MPRIHNPNYLLFYVHRSHSSRKVSISFTLFPHLVILIHSRSPNLITNLSYSSAKHEAHLPTTSPDEIRNIPSEPSKLARLTSDALMIQSIPFPVEYFDTSGQP
ncbi:hypothetical protein PGT21_030157 [Puccinia graminis f. sp. tritici]|uniref:Uncharacterized protein n=1 Tax=Puccinia graminis f. sp. tritici TaxID=56615 RepID=A0A5B0Q6V6_PUCGR|nr:hypothetical protein PGT21_030157 [Puccinia graminis f. sp. tritici]